MSISIAILGSTGSIGLSTLSIIDKKRNFFKINLLSANKNYKQICKQIIKYNPNFFVINDLVIFKKIKKKFKNRNIIILNSLDSFKFKKKIDITVSAIPGLAGLEPTIFMLKLSKKILIANKESVICGWDLIKKNSLKYKTKIIPVDSEHFSILKLLKNNNLKDIKKIFITASGGPFLNYKLNQFKKIKPKDALKHPKWKMGKKITIDSATLMNKILELIEAQKLFKIPNHKLDILIHPESLVHAIVELKNGLTKFIYHETSMIIPLVNAIFDEKLNIEDFYKIKKKIRDLPIKNLTFDTVNKKKFPTIRLKSVANKHPSSPIIVNASNEILVDQFLQKKIPFTGIFKIIMSILNDRNYKKYAIRKPKNINQINIINDWAKQVTYKKINK
jgi:1-deoxy-D-xylulose-5-phosphate reductoisomerase